MLDPPFVAQTDAQDIAVIQLTAPRAALDLCEVYAVRPESGPDASQWRTEFHRRLVSHREMST